MRAKLNEPDPEITSVEYIVGNGDQESTPTTDRRNQALETIADAERGLDNEDEEYEDMNNFQFDSLEDNNPLIMTGLTDIFGPLKNCWLN